MRHAAAPLIRPPREVLQLGATYRSRSFLPPRAAAISRAGPWPPSPPPRASIPSPRAAGNRSRGSPGPAACRARCGRP
jgi:hypothetical protein